MYVVLLSSLRVCMCVHGRKVKGQLLVLLHAHTRTSPHALLPNSHKNKHTHTHTHTGHDPLLHRRLQQLRAGPGRGRRHLRAQLRWVRPHRSILTANDKPVCGMVWGGGTLRRLQRSAAAQPLNLSRACVCQARACVMHGRIGRSSVSCHTVSIFWRLGERPPKKHPTTRLRFAVYNSIPNPESTQGKR